MADREELRRLREEIDQLRERANRLRERLDALEADTERAKPPEPLVPPPPVKPRREEPTPTPPKRPTPPDIDAERKPSAPHEEPSGPLALGEQAVTRAKAKVREEGWEVLLGTYWLPRIGILVVATSVVLLLSLAIQQWGPPVRVGIGYGVCLALLALGWRLERNYGTYARVLYSGGIALSYFVTYASHYIPFARVIESPAVALTLLTAVVVAWAVVAEVRGSRIVAMMVTLLGHYTIFLSGPGQYSVMAIFVLSAGSAYFLLRHRWYYVAMVGIVGSYVNHFLWMHANEGTGRTEDFWLSMLFLSGYFVIFALAELFSDEDLRRKRIPTWFRSGFVTLNTAGFLILGTILVYQFEFTRPHQDLFRFATAGALILIALGYLLRRNADPLYNVYLVKGIAVFTLGLAARYSGNSLSAWLAVETVVLLISARRSGLIVNRLLAFAIALIAFAQALYTTLNTGIVAYDNPVFMMRTTEAVLAVLAFFMASLLYERTDWTPRTPSTGPFPSVMLAFFYWLDLVTEFPRGVRYYGKPCKGLLFPYVYALGGGALFMLYTTDLVATHHDVLTISVLAFALTIAAALLASRPYGLVSMILVGLAFIQWTADHALSDRPDGRLALITLAALAGVALSSEAPLLGRRRGLAFHQSKPAPYFLYTVVAIIWAMFVADELSTFNSASVLTLSAAVTAGLFLVLHARAMACVSTLLLLWGQTLWFTSSLRLPSGIGREDGLAWALILLPLCLDRYYRLGWAKKRDTIRTLGIILVGSSWFFLLFDYIGEKALPDPVPFWRALAGCAFLLYGLAFRSKPGVGFSLAGALVTSAHIAGYSYTHTMDTTFLILGYGLLIGFWILCERLYTWASTRFDVRAMISPAGPFVALATGLAVLLLERLPHLSDYYLTASWTVLAGTLFIMALVFHGRQYRYAGLVVFALALGRAFMVDMRDLQGLYKVAAFAVLGTVLLAVGLGYAAAKRRLPQAQESFEESDQPMRREE